MTDTPELTHEQVAEISQEHTRKKMNRIIFDENRVRMIEQEITLTITCAAALELRELIEWTNDSQFKRLVQSIDQKLYDVASRELPPTD